MQTEHIDNPLLSASGIPDFAAIHPEHVEPAVSATLEELRKTLHEIENSEPSGFEWALRLEKIQERLQRVWAPVVHLNSVCSTPALRDAYNACLPLITEFWLELGQNERLYAGYERLRRDGLARDAAEQRVVHNALRDFRLAGVALDPPQRAQFNTISKELAAAQARFEQNLLDATDAFRWHETESTALAGLPPVVLERARRTAQAEGADGYVLLLDPPTYTAIMAQAESETLRQKFYEAWMTRASDQGPHAGQWDNTQLIEQILALRHESATLLGFASFAELSLATKMARSPTEVTEFLKDLSARSRPVAQRELAALERLAGRKLKAWDIAFYAERLKRERFALSAEELRPYFPLPRVLDGLFNVVRTLFEIEIRPVEACGLWNSAVRYFELYDSAGRGIGGLFTDLYARPNKRGGAWMDGALSRTRLLDLNQAPIAHLVCNFNPPGDGEPSLLTHEEVVTLFHEFGHALHHLLTEIDYPSIAGIHGVAWDAVELPSQFFENYAWLPDALPWISSHFETGDSLPAEKLATLKASRSFNAGLSMLRQLEFALFDFRLHAEYDPARGSRVAEILNEVRAEVAVIEVPEYNRFPNTFSHIFGGGYAAGYYSYKWAEVLAADAFSAFTEAGGFSRDTAARFRRCILASGGSRDALEAYTEFRGRGPSLEPLLQQSGIVSGAPTV